LLESRIEELLVRKIKQAGGWALKLVSPGNAGVPDRLVLLPGGRVIFVELKTETGSLSPLQVDVHRRLRELGMDVVTLYGRDEVLSFVEEVKNDADTTGANAADSQQ
jgi:hypothetical protein